MSKEQQLRQESPEELLHIQGQEGYLLTAAPPDLEHGVAPLGSPAPTQPPLLGCRVAFPFSTGSS